ncbi:12033_t:CDS:2 [Cetraspora pellucida]|uniref:12033_t:CDS:1 n=1 Tax=Cetraspora pellucida TaxID=1433469 RepID=A0A9N9G8S3_9GLOM|nr:12033_t:CDS:2 [Cetraspora pellucida]
MQTNSNASNYNKLYIYKSSTNHTAPITQTWIIEKIFVSNLPLINASVQKQAVEIINDTNKKLAKCQRAYNATNNSEA